MAPFPVISAFSSGPRPRGLGLPRLSIEEGMPLAPAGLGGGSRHLRVAYAFDWSKGIGIYDSPMNLKNIYCVISTSGCTYFDIQPEVEDGARSTGISRVLGKLCVWGGGSLQRDEPVAALLRGESGRSTSGRYLYPDKRRYLQCMAVWLRSDSVNISPLSGMA